MVNFKLRPNPMVQGVDNSVRWICGAINPYSPVARGLMQIPGESHCRDSSPSVGFILPKQQTLFGVTHEQLAQPFNSTNDRVPISTAKVLEKLCMVSLLDGCVDQRSHTANTPKLRGSAAAVCALTHGVR